MPAAPPEVLHGDCLDVMRRLNDDSVDAVVCDPPYGIGFRGHEWDQARHQGRRNGNPATGRFGRSAAVVAGRYDRSLEGNRLFQGWCEEWAAEALRVVKPCGHLLAFGAPRTYHRLAAGIEDAGFEIRGTIAWLFGQGFPKALSVAKAIDKAAGVDTSAIDWQPTSEDAKAWMGWQTQLKPGHEPIVVARAPAAHRSIVRNVLEHGTGALNIDACRIALRDGDECHDFNRGYDGHPYRPHELGRFPADVVLDADAAAELDARVGELRSGANPKRRSSSKFANVYGTSTGHPDCAPARGADVGGPSRFFYVAKAGIDERDAGCQAWGGNPHPTPKPIALMRWLVRLVTPPGGVVLDPFAGSGSTGIAAALGGFGFVGIEREPFGRDPKPYVDVARARIAWWQRHGDRPPPRRPRAIPVRDQQSFDAWADQWRPAA